MVKFHWSNIAYRDQKKSAPFHCEQMIKKITEMLKISDAFHMAADDDGVILMR